MIWSDSGIGRQVDGCRLHRLTSAYLHSTDNQVDNQKVTMREYRSLLTDLRQQPYYIPYGVVRDARVVQSLKRSI